MYFPYACTCSITLYEVSISNIATLVHGGDKGVQHQDATAGRSTLESTQETWSESGDNYQSPQSENKINHPSLIGEWSIPPIKMMIWGIADDCFIHIRHVQAVSIISCTLLLPAGWGWIVTYEQLGAPFVRSWLPAAILVFPRCWFTNRIWRLWIHDSRTKMRVITTWLPSDLQGSPVEFCPLLKFHPIAATEKKKHHHSCHGHGFSLSTCQHTVCLYTD